MSDPFTENLNETTDPQPGDWMDIVDVSAPAGDKDRKLSVARLALLATAQTFTGAKTFTQRVIAPALRNRQEFIDSQAAISFEPLSVFGIVLINTNAANGDGIANYRASGGAFCNTIAGLSDFEATTGVLTGSTGTNGKFTVSAHTDGKIYIENRTGIGRNVNIIIFG